MEEPFVLHLGDCREVMAFLPDESVDAIVTDPPYELGFMGKAWDAAGAAYDVAVWSQALRVLKPGGHLLAFGGSRTYHRLACAIEDAGFEIRDQIMWVYGSGFPKSLNLKDEWDGWGTALKPAHEPIVVARKPLIGTVAANVLRYGTGALNIDGCRVPFTSEADEKESKTKNQHADFGTPPMTGNTVYGDFSMVQPQNYDPPGRWPANFIHDGDQTVLDLFPDSTTWAANKPRDYDTDSMFGVGGRNFAPASSGSAARFFYCAKASKRDRDEGNRHPTVKPTDLMRYLVRLVTPPGGVVLDPFTGSGSTGKAAMLEGFRFVGIEQDAEYLAIAQARIGSVLVH